MVETPFGFTGEWRDGGTGMYYLRARYYSPANGTFVSQDVLETPNRYAYVGGNVVNRVDPSGMIFWAFPTSDPDRLLEPDEYTSTRPAHAWIEYWLEQQNGFFRSHAEFPGSGSKIDILVFDPDMPSAPFSEFVPTATAFFGGVNGAVYEIEPVKRPDKIATGYIEILSKWNAISAGIPPFLHRGIIAPNGDGWRPPRPAIGFSGRDYDWSDVNWILGNRLTSSIDMGPVRVDPAFLGEVSGLGDAYWIALPTDGLILYLSERDMLRRGLASTAAFAANEIWRQYLRAMRGRQGGVLPQPRPIPAPILQPESDWLSLSADGQLCIFMNSGTCIAEGTDFLDLFSEIQTEMMLPWRLLR